LLKGGAVVTTLMSNMGLEKYLKSLGLEMYRAAVGDRYVLEMMREKECNLGGEQSGHVIMLDSNTTGDGLMTALQLLCAMKEKSLPLESMAKGMTLFPQKLWNIMLSERKDVMADADVQSWVNHAEQSLGDKGRVNVRMSGTEPKLRIMVEADSDTLMLSVGEELVQRIQAHVL
jgi:phosphoglucosamine mutase